MPSATVQSVQSYLKLWRLDPDGPPTSTPRSVVQFAWRDGVPLVLKLVTHKDEAGQRAALVHFAGRGAVRPIDWDGPAILMERSVPGTPLTQLVRAGRDDEATSVVCAIMAQLQQATAPPSEGFRTVESWGRGFNRLRPVAEERGVDMALMDRAEELYSELCASQGPRVLLHGDLHHYNILQDARRSWLAIDPKGVLGEAAFEAGAMLRNPVGEMRLFADSAVISRRTAIMTERLNLDRRRVLGWAFSQAVLSALWSIEDGGEPGQGLAMARATLPLL